LSVTNGDRDLYSGLIRLHVLHHASEEAIYGQGMIEELQRHGYRIGPGTLYPILHALEKRGFLRARRVSLGRTWRKEYRITARGARALTAARERVRELFGEMFEKP
jgi:DNA-binding PadR family transcriptional regulator